MHHHYNDIRSRIAEPPIWWDEHAVPRYEPFAPNQVADIYCDRAALVDIACQNCGERFLVAFSEGSWQRHVDKRDLESDARDGSLHYGDPPNAGCCAAGPTMNCNDLRVVEFWRREDFDWRHVWRRVPELEVVLADHPDFATTTRPDGAP